jgi:hypothetical protein
LEWLWAPTEMMRPGQAGNAITYKPRDPVFGTKGITFAPLNWCHFISEGQSMAGDINNVGGSPPLPLVLWAELIEEVRRARQKTAARVAKSKAIRARTATLISESQAARAACQESRTKALG